MKTQPITILTSALIAVAAHGAVVTSVDTTADNGTLTGWVSSTDLLETQGTTVSFTDYVAASGSYGNSADILRDGSVGSSVNLSPGDQLTEANGQQGNGWLAEFSLDTTVNTLGYDITSFASISSTHFGNLDEQSFDLFVRTVGGGWTEIGNGFTGNATPDGGVRVTVSDDTAQPLATGVDGIRFSSTGSLRGSYRELDVFGTPTIASSIPEPTSMALIGIASVILIWKRNVQRMVAM